MPTGKRGYLSRLKTLLVFLIFNGMVKTKLAILPILYCEEIVKNYFNLKYYPLFYLWWSVILLRDVWINIPSQTTRNFRDPTGTHITKSDHLHGIWIGLREIWCANAMANSGFCWRGEGGGWMHKPKVVGAPNIILHNFPENYMRMKQYCTFMAPGPPIK